MRPYKYLPHVIHQKFCSVQALCVAYSFRVANILALKSTRAMMPHHCQKFIRGHKVPVPYFDQYGVFRDWSEHWNAEAFVEGIRARGSRLSLPIQTAQPVRVVVAATLARSAAVMPSNSRSSKSLPFVRGNQRIRIQQKDPSDLYAHHKNIGQQ